MARYTFSQVLRVFGTTEDRLIELRTRCLIAWEVDDSGELYFEDEQLEQARLVLNLIENLNVNPEGVEVILRLRSRNLELQRKLMELLRED